MSVDAKSADGGGGDGSAKGDWRAFYDSGLTYTRKGMHDFAIRDFTRAIQIKPELEVPYNLRGSAYHKIGERRLALRDLTHAIELSPTFAAAYKNRGKVYQDEGESELAIADYSKAIELDPEFASALNCRGWMYANRNLYQVAIKDLNRAVELKDGYVTALYHRGVVYQNKGDYELAIRDFALVRELAEAGGKDRSADLQRATLRLAAACNSSGRYSDANLHFSRVIKSDARNEEAIFGRGVAQGMLGNFKYSLQDFTSVVDINAKHAAAYFYRGHVYKVLDQHSLGDADIAKALKLEPLVRARVTCSSDPAVSSFMGKVIAAATDADA